MFPHTPATWLMHSVSLILEVLLALGMEHILDLRMASICREILHLHQADKEWDGSWLIVNFHEMNMKSSWHEISCHELFPFHPMALAWKYQLMLSSPEYWPLSVYQMMFISWCLPALSHGKLVVNTPVTVSFIPSAAQAQMFQDALSCLSLFPTGDRDCSYL